MDNESKLKKLLAYHDELAPPATTADSDAGLVGKGYDTYYYLRSEIDRLTKELARYEVARSGARSSKQTRIEYLLGTKNWHKKVGLEKELDRLITECEEYLKLGKPNLPYGMYLTVSQLRQAYPVYYGRRIRLKRLLAVLDTIPSIESNGKRTYSLRRFINAARR